MGLVILTSLTALLPGQPVGDLSAQGDGDLRQLVHILGGAYQNALLHDSAKSGMEANDALLESAAIKFSVRLLDELNEVACSAGQLNAGDTACPLDDPSLAFGDWTEMISYSAYRLENLSRSSGAAGETDSSAGLARERMASMEHLYRMVFALSKIHFDRSQSGTYVDAAREQLAQAHMHIEAERDLCGCDATGYAAKLQELSRLSDQMSGTRQTALP